MNFRCMFMSAFVCAAVPAFLTRLVNRQLGVSAHAYEMTAKLTEFGQLPRAWQVNGKYGASSGFGWYVGWATEGARTYVFAHLMRKDKTPPEDAPAGLTSPTTAASNSYRLSYTYERF